MTEAAMLRDRIDTILDLVTSLERDNERLREREKTLQHQVDALEQELAKET